MNKMHLGASIRDGFARYFDFAGRTSRSTFWDWVLFVFLAAVVAAILDSIIFGSSTINFGLLPSRGTPLIETIFSLGLLIPNLAIIARRLRDAGFNPLWELLLLIPGLGLIILLVMSTRRGPQD